MKVSRSQSPCIQLCRMDDNDQYCLGCYRTLEEISMWPNLSDDEKELIWLALEHRKPS
jgi:predicted Fe-S protein YdhL (DUF1289 family)